MANRQAAIAGVIVDAVATGTKAQLRAGLLAARRLVSPAIRAAEARAVAELAAALVSSGETVCAYVPVGSEPGSIEMLDGLVNAGARVLLPVATTSDDDTPLPLKWGEYRPGQLVKARLGLLEPAPPWLPVTALGEAALVLIPALAVDRRGVRLGRGAGFYDRSLASRAAGARLVAVIRDDELVEELPAESHDVRMTHALTPGLGLIAL